jgi:hypothetical protein
MSMPRAALITTLMLMGCPPDNASPGLIGESCSAAVSCARGLTCAHDAICREQGAPGTTLEGDTCENSSACALDLVCSSAGTCATQGSAGTAAAAETCTTDSDCRRGLECFEDRCIGLEVPFWAGAVCEPPDEAETFRAYFEVPERDDIPAEFYRLPYPNDIHIDDSEIISLAGHAAPGPLLDVVGDVVGNVMRVVEQDSGGFGPNQAVFVRFTDTPDFDSLDIGVPGDGGTVAIVDITPGEDVDRTLHPSLRFRAASGRRAYICQNWLAVYPGDGAPLLPGHTYALVLSRDILDGDGNRLEPDADFRQLMEEAQPESPRLARAWVQYAPLRAWLDERGIARSSIGGGSVFTIQDTTDGPATLYEQIQAAPVPAISGEILCDGANDPFADVLDDTRGCQTDGTGPLLEIQAQVALPQFQSGMPPFKDTIDGGTIDFRGLPPEPVRDELVNLALTVPAGAEMPADGWPLVLYGHGTDGNYTSGIRSGIADLLTEVEVDLGSVSFATATIDAPLHGPRAAPANWKSSWLEVDPDAYASDVLFFNPLNPAAARDNVLQAAADHWALLRALQELDWTAGDSPTGEAIRFDPDQIYYVGHSQGGVVGPTFLAYEPDVRAAVLSGAGGFTLASFLGKTSPHDVPSALRVALADLDLDREHPILNLAQQVAERADGVNHASQLLLAPREGFDRKHVLQIFGVGDTYSPDAAQFSLARALGLQQVPGDNAPLDLLDRTSLPAMGNGPGSTTAVVHLYSAISQDPHFVLFERADAQRHLATFLATSVRDGTPTIQGL